jgi:predicted transposase/invertase (TIGR01784 family)
MGTKDITEKMLEDYNDVFADIVNVLLFDGQQRVNPDHLLETKTKSMFKADGKVHEQERDVSKYWENVNVRIALYGIENQTIIDADMPLRVYSYDGAAYKQQLLSGTKRYPVVTLVLYFGTKRWDKPTSLLDCFDVPEELKPYVNDSKINLFEIAYLTDEQVKLFQSDFRIVADYFVQVRKNNDYKPSEEEMVHVEEVLKMMSALTQDSSFEDAYNHSEGGVKNMCEVMERTKAEGIAKGRLQGRAEGRLSGSIMTLLELGFSVEEIAERKGISEEKVLKIIEEEEKN